MASTFTAERAAYRTLLNNAHEFKGREIFIIRLLTQYFSHRNEGIWVPQKMDNQQASISRLGAAVCHDV